MGLLTDPGMEGGKMSAFLLAHNKLLAVLLYVTGAIWFASLAHNAMNHGTYFSENALLPGLVQGEFKGESLANRYLTELNKECEKYQKSIPYAWLHAKFTQLGLDTYSHNFTLNFPLAKDTSYSGRNVYGILRAVRATSTESIVISAPYRPPNSIIKSNAPAIALMLALASFFSEQVYWAKDIIFLVTEHEQLGAEAWLEAYHSTTAGMEGVLDHGHLPARAGPIQAAVNLEIAESLVPHLDIKVEGLNGQLPNLDLVNLLNRLCNRESIPHTIKNRPDYPYPETWEGFIFQLKTLAFFIATQASGVPNGNHGLFHRYGIAAVTVVGDGRRIFHAHRSATLLHIGRVLEGVCRSLNNLLERFHQSFFFYLIPASNRYISIGVYMPAFGMLASPLLVIALALWCSSHLKAQKQLATEMEEEERKLKQMEDDDLSEEEECNEEEQVEPENFSLLGCCGVMVPTHVLCALLNWCPKNLALSGEALGLTAEECVMLGLLAFCVVLLQLPYFMHLYNSNVRYYSWEVLKCLAVLELSVLLFAGALHNLSLALIMTVLYVPVVLVVAPSVTWPVRMLRRLLLLLIHPLTLMGFLVLLDSSFHFPEENFFGLLDRASTSSKRALMFSVVDAMIYGNWVYPVACCFLLPVWMTLWHVVNSPVL